MENDDKKLGVLGEEIAVKYLLSHGYQILDRNWRDGHKELDIVTRLDGMTIFVEVKLRRDLSFSGEIGALHRDQIKTLRLAILSYCFKHRIDLEKTRLDLIIVSPDFVKKVARIKYFPGLY
ncbi:MAG: YraN family protein [Candidatus Falkowbacteria bacterium]